MKRFVCIINGWNSINRDPKTATGMLAAGHRAIVSQSLLALWVPCLPSTPGNPAKHPLNKFYDSDHVVIIARAGSSAASFGPIRADVAARLRLAAG